MKPTISLIVCDTTSRNKIQQPVHKTIEVIKQLSDFDGVSCVHWICDKPMYFDVNVPVKWTKINPIDPRIFPIDYNYVMLKLVPHVVTEDYSLTIHWDGFACNPEAWTSEFLEYDYIGAYWPHRGTSGNGGFSLRSRKLQDALLQEQLDHAEGNGEDSIICLNNRDLLIQKHGINFPPNELADQFSIEMNLPSPWLGKSFGFHGCHPEVAPRYGHPEIIFCPNGY